MIVSGLLLKIVCPAQVDAKPDVSSIPNSKIIYLVPTFSHTLLR